MYRIAPRKPRCHCRRPNGQELGSFGLTTEVGIGVTAVALAVVALARDDGTLDHTSPRFARLRGELPCGLRLY